MSVLCRCLLITTLDSLQLRFFFSGNDINVAGLMNERTKQIGTFRTILQPQIRRRLADVETNKMFKKKIERERRIILV